MGIKYLCVLALHIIDPMKCVKELKSVNRLLVKQQ